MTFDLAQMIADREAGTPGEWRIRINKGDDEDVCDVSICGDIFVLADLNGPQYAHQYPNARRIARVPLLEAEIIRLTARVAELEGALKPLADMAERYDPDEGDDWNLECWSGLAVPKIHHLRTARAALSTHTEEPKT